jgi:hypothetical protein
MSTVPADWARCLLTDGDYVIVPAGLPGQSRRFDLTLLSEHDPPGDPANGGPHPLVQIGRLRLIGLHRPVGDLFDEPVRPGSAECGDDGTTVRREFKAIIDAEEGALIGPRSPP